MTIELSESIFPTRGFLSDIPEEYATDLQIYRDLKRAKKFVDQILVTGLDESLLTSIYEAVGAYYTYVNWTGIAEQRVGTIPALSFFRVAVLREQALQLMAENVIVPISDNLTIDYKRFSKMRPSATTVPPSLLDDSE
jgi:hypothetical protein